MPKRSIELVTIGTPPQRLQTRKSAVRVPNEYFETREESRIVTLILPAGLEVHTPPCFTQKVQPQARAGISFGSGSHVRPKAMLPQWQLPSMTIYW